MPRLLPFTFIRELVRAALHFFITAYIGCWWCQGEIPGDRFYQLGASFPFAAVINLSIDDCRYAPMAAFYWLCRAVISAIAAYKSLYLVIHWRRFKDTNIIISAPFRDSIPHYIRHSLFKAILSHAKMQLRASRSFFATTKLPASLLLFKRLRFEAPIPGSYYIFSIQKTLRLKYSGQGLSTVATLITTSRLRPEAQSLSLLADRKLIARL